MLLDVSAVVVAQMHNPTVLHPAFLSKEGIVPNDWALGEEPISTPALAQVMYQNGLSIVVQPARMAVKIENRPRTIANRIITDVTSAIIKKLPYVPYKAVGLNYTFFKSMDRADDFIVDELISSRISQSEQFRPTVADIKILFAVEQAQSTLQFSAGKVQKPNWSELRAGMFARANLHSDLAGDDPVGDATTRLRGLFRFGEWCDDVFRSLVPELAEGLAADENDE